MKKVLFLLIVLSAFLMSCGHFHDAPTVSVWANGFWLVPWVAAIGAAIFFVVAFISANSNSDQQLPGTAGYNKNTGNISVWNAPWIYLGIFLTLFCIGVIIYANSGYWK